MTQNRRWCSAGLIISLQVNRKNKEMNQITYLLLFAMIFITTEINNLSDFNRVEVWGIEWRLDRFLTSYCFFCRFPVHLPEVWPPRGNIKVSFPGGKLWRWNFNMSQVILFVTLPPIKNTFSYFLTYPWPNLWHLGDFNSKIA